MIPDVAFVHPGLWFQVSRRHRMVACLPPGEDGLAALSRVMWPHMLPNRMGETEAGDHYLRCHAQREGRCRTLTPEQFEAFRLAGGGTYAGAQTAKAHMDRLGHPTAP